MSVDEHTVKFTEWLVAACKELCGEKNVTFGYSIDDNAKHIRNIEEVKQSLAEQNSVYYIRTCYNGDPDCGLYVSDVDEDNNGLTRLDNACKKMLHAAYG